MKPVDCLSDAEFAHLAQRAARLPDAPAPLVERAIALWPQAGATRLTDVAGAALRLVSAVLSFDSWARPAVALGMRSVATDTRHLLFSAKGRDIDLRISPAAGQFALTGQVLGPDEAGIVEIQPDPELAAADSAPRFAALDTLGEFRIDEVAPGSYRLTLRVGGDTIVLPPIVVAARPG